MQAHFMGGPLHGQSQSVSQDSYAHWDGGRGCAVRYVRCEPTGNGFAYRLDNPVDQHNSVFSNDFLRDPCAPEPGLSAGQLLHSLADASSHLENLERTLARTKADKKSASKRRDEILAQLAELEIVVDGV